MVLGRGSVCMDRQYHILQYRQSIHLNTSVGIRIICDTFDLDTIMSAGADDRWRIVQLNRCAIIG